jgi:hypothetical protein
MRVLAPVIHKAGLISPPTLRFETTNLYREGDVTGPRAVP